ncbi:MAG: hypothetical protein LLG00_03270 [Planctomycetaceae bacterium]|nr:hypothetical protein [Planctomycetaceae bacterium]
MRKRTIAIVVAILVLLTVGAVWACFRDRRDPQVETVKAMLGNGPPTREIRQAMEKLSPDQRRQVHQAWGEQRQRQADKEIDDFFNLPPEKRVAELDKRIQEMEKRRKEWEQRRAEAQAKAASGQSAGQTPGRGNPGGPRGGRSSNPTARSERANQRLDNSSPAQRAQRQAYRTALQQRRIQLGLPVNPWQGRGPRGG